MSDVEFIRSKVAELSDAICQREQEFILSFSKKAIPCIASRDCRQLQESIRIKVNRVAGLISVF